MKNIYFTLLISMLLLCAFAPKTLCEEALSPSQLKADILKLIDAEIDEETIVLHVKNTELSAPLTDEDVLLWEEDGISKRIIEAVLDSGKKEETNQGPEPGAASIASLRPTLSTAVLSDDKNIDVATVFLKPLPRDIGVIVRRFPSDSADIGKASKKIKRMDAVETMKREAPVLLAQALVQNLSESGLFLSVEESEEAVPANAIVIEGRFVKIDPGSRAKRYWAGFGAGKSGVAVMGTVKNSQGEVLAEFEHMKHSGIGMYGGNYIKFLTDDTKDVAKNLAQFLTAWVQGDNPKKD